MKLATKNTLFNIAHTIIMLLIAFDIFTSINPDFSKYELPIFLSICGFGVGIGFGGFWEYIIEQNMLRMPASKGDLINMAISGIVGAVATAYIEIPTYLLWILSIISSIFVILYFCKMWKSRESREKIDF